MSAFWLWVERLNHSAQFLPWDNPIPVIQEQFLTGLLAEFLETAVSQGLLTHRSPFRINQACVSETDASGHESLQDEVISSVVITIRYG
jgi:hypothetical protein